MFFSFTLPTIWEKTEKIFLYFAKLGTRGSQNLDEDEFIDVHEFTLDELKQYGNK